MEKASSGETDLDEWEYIPDDGDDHGFLDIQLSRDMGFDQKGVFDMNYFICPSPTASRRIFDAPQNSGVPIPRRTPSQLVPIPIRLEPLSGKNPDHEFVKDIAEVPIADMAEKIIALTPEAAVTGDQDMISQVFFKKMKENEFVDMKMDSPKSGNTGIKPPAELGSIQFEEKDAGLKGEADKEHNERSSKAPAEQEMVKNDYSNSKIKGESNWEEGGAGGFCFWKWGLSGIGALCSVGVAAATICVFIFGSHQRHKHHQNQKLRFQIYADDKRIKEMVSHASRLNHALSSVRGVPLTRATISFGGYYDGI